MAAWRPDDDWYDRRESLGQQREADGEPATEGFYPSWVQPSHVVAELRSELRTLNELIDEIVDAA